MKEESRHEKSRRLEENLILQRERKGRAAPSSQRLEKSVASEVKISIQDHSSSNTDDWIHLVTKAEPVNIREQLPLEAVHRVIHPYHLHYWIPARAVEHHYFFPGLLLFLSSACIYFFYKILRTKYTRISNNLPGHPVKRSIRELFNLVQKARQCIAGYPSKRELDFFRVTINEFADDESWKRDEEKLLVLMDQITYILKETDDKRIELEDELDRIIDHWFCSLQRALYCLHVSTLLNNFQKDLWWKYEKIQESNLERGLKLVDREISSALNKELTLQPVPMDQIVSVGVNQNSSMNLIVQMQQENRLQRQREQLQRDLDKDRRRISRELEQCRDRLEDKGKQKKKLKRWRQQRQILMEVINRSTFVATFIPIAIALWSMQSACNFGHGVHSYLQCAIIGTLDTTCRYISSNESLMLFESAGDSSIITLAQSPMQFIENLLVTPSETLYNTLLRLPIDALSLTNYVMRLTLSQSKLLPSSLNYVLCGGNFFTRCVPALLVQFGFGMIYLPSVGSFASWLILFLLFYDVILQLLNEPLRPFIILSCIQLVFYVTSCFITKIDFDRNLLFFYMTYLVTMVSFPIFWQFRYTIIEECWKMISGIQDIQLLCP
jgi:hypothetical protein